MRSGRDIGQRMSLPRARRVHGRLMKTAQQGYTLIELMIVTGIIGILGSIAIPAYQDYTIRAQVAEGISLSAGTRVALVDYYTQTGDWPNNNNKADVAGQNEIRGKYVKMVMVKKNEIEIQYGNEAHKNIKGKKIVLTAIDNRGIIRWECSGKGGFEERYLPNSCK